MSMIECPNCGEMIPDDGRFCDQCGAELLRCINCGSIGVDDFCGECGQPMISLKISTNNSKNTINTNISRRADTTATESYQSSASAQNLDRTIANSNRRKTIILKARFGNLVLKPENGAVIGRKDSPYEQQLSNLDMLSRQHAKFVSRGAEWYIVDLESTNGTYINNIESQPNQLTKFVVGDVIDLGTYIFDVVEL